jgi:RNA recognition motif-containing protein
MISKPTVGTDWQRAMDLRYIIMSNSKLYVGNLSFKTTEDELRSAFSQFGTVTDLYVAMDKMTGRPRGFAFVTMGTPEEAKLATEKMNGLDLGGGQLSVNEARPAAAAVVASAAAAAVVVSAAAAVAAVTAAIAAAAATVASAVTNRNAIR